MTQYGCDALTMITAEVNTAAERADAYAFQQPLTMARIVEKVTAALPDAIVDFDVTEA